MDVQNIIQNQLLQYYSVIAQERENRVKVRNWVITIWLSYLALLGSGNYYTHKWIAYMMLAIIIAIFCCVEGFHQSIVIVNEERAKSLKSCLPILRHLDNWIWIYFMNVDIILLNGKQN